MNDQLKLKILADLIRIISYNDYDEETMRRVLIFCSYHKLLDKSYYDGLPKGKLWDLVVDVFESIGEKAESL